MNSVICIDLDGVLNDFDEWRGADYFHPPRPGAREFLQQLHQRGYQVVIFTVRWKPHVEQWLMDHQLAEFVSDVTDKKLPAHVYVDDRALCFHGDFSEVLAQIQSFRAHWES